MQTTINQVGPVEYELEITATAADLASDIQKALREQQRRTQLKGFRPGKVPLGLVKKMYGKALAYEVADRTIQEIYEDVVLESDDHDVLGQPRLTRLDYEIDQDLHAVVQFGVRPEVVLQDLSQERLTRLVHDVTDEEIDAELERLRQDRADLVPVEDEPAGEDDLVVFDLQELDAATQTPIIGKRDEDQQLFLDDPRQDENPMLAALSKALRGARAGDTVRFHFEHDQAHGLHAPGEVHVHHFAATVKDIKRRDVPELDDAFVEELTDGEVESVEAFRTVVEEQLERSWERNARDFLESEIIERMLALHPVPVPASVVDFYLDSFVEDVKERNEGTLPDNFPEADFRRANREEAEKQARWMLLRDHLVETERLDVAEEDFDAFFEEQAGDGRLTTAQFRQFYQAMPQLMDQLEGRLLNQKVFDVLATRFELVDKDEEAVRQELEARRTTAEAAPLVDLEAAAAEEKR